MAQNNPQLSILPAEIMESQLSTVDLLLAMFPSPGELEIPESTAECIEKLRLWTQNPAGMPARIPSSVSLAVRLPIAETRKTLQVNISIPLQCEDLETAQPPQPPPLGYSLRQPDWMSKAEVARLASSIPRGDVFEALQYIQEEASHFLAAQQDATPQHTPTTTTTTAAAGGPPSKPIVRVWFYLPSLSSRGKRDDLVNHAPEYSLTGFVLAGKPGVLCLEGGSADIDAYMSFIKTHSWGDIPSHQKKVSERFREAGGVQRVFSGMEEITDSLGARGGQRANRGDMQALEAWLRARGLAEAFEKVIF